MFELQYFSFVLPVNGFGIIKIIEIKTGETGE